MLNSRYDTNPGVKMKILASILFFLTFSVFSAEQITLTSTNFVNINDEVNDLTMSVAAHELFLSCLNKPEPKYLVLNSPGGSISAGRQFIDFAKGVPCKVHSITIFAASMGYHIAQALGKRYIIPSGTMMSHRAKLSGVGGQLPGELISELNYYAEFIEQLERDVAKRVGISLEQYKKEIYDELWLIGENAVNRKHADLIVVPKCDASLSGTYDKEVSTLFGAFTLTFSKCPMITGPVGFKQAKADLVQKLIDFFENKNKKEIWYK